MVITLNVVCMESELGTDGHRVPAPMHTHCAVIERDAPCPQQLRASIGSCEMRINYELKLQYLQAGRTLLSWERANAAVG